MRFYSTILEIIYRSSAIATATPLTGAGSSSSSEPSPSAATAAPSPSAATAAAASRQSFSSQNDSDKSTESPLRKRRQTDKSGSSGPVKTEESEEETDPIPINKCLEILAPPFPPVGLFHRWLELCLPLPNELVEAGVGFNITSPYIDEFNLSAWGMNHGGSGSYYVYPGESGKFDPKGGKFGSSTDFPRRWEEKYKDKGKEGLIVHNWQRYKEVARDIVVNNIKRCFSLIEESFKEKGGLTEWLKDATIYDGADLEKKEGGFSLFYAIWLNYVLNDPEGAGRKYGVQKNLQIRHLETALQYFYGISNGAMYEQLHFPVFEEFIIPNYELVKDATERLLEKIEGADFGIGVNREELKFERDAIEVTWEPGSTLNSRQQLKRTCDDVFGNRNLQDMNAEEIDRLMNEKGQSHLIEDVQLDDLANVENIVELVELIFSQDDDDRSLGLFLSVTEMLYDVNLDTIDSYGLGKWRNPYGDRPSKNVAYDPSKLDHEAAREDHRETIKRLAKTVDECKKKGVVFVSLIDRMMTAYKDEEQLHDILIGKGFEKIERFGQVTAFGYRNKDRTCMALVLVHHAFSKAFTSRPPWEDQGPVRGEEKIEEHSITAVTFLYVHAIMMTVNGITDNFQPTNKMLGNSVTAFAMIMYCLMRMHMGDSRVAVAFGKAMIALENHENPLAAKFGLNQKHINRNAAGSGGLSTAEMVALFLSKAGNDVVEAAFKKFFEGDRIDRGNGRDALQILNSLKGDYLDERGDLYQALKTRINSEVEGKEEEAEEKDNRAKNDQEAYLQSLIGKWEEDNLN